MAKYNRRQMLRATGVTITPISALMGMSSGVSAASSPDEVVDVDPASGSNIRKLARDENFRLNRETAREHGHTLSLGNAAVVSKDDGDEKFVVPTSRSVGRDSSPSADAPGYHVTADGTSVESVLFLDGETVYVSGDAGNESGRRTDSPGAFQSTSSAYPVSLPGFSRSRVATDEVCEELRSTTDDIVCLSVVGATTLYTWAARSIPYIGAALSATCAVHSEVCSRWPNVYEDTMGTIPGQGCADDEVYVYKPKWWNPIDDNNVFLAPVCEIG